MQMGFSGQESVQYGWGAGKTRCDRDDCYHIKYFPIEDELMSFQAECYKTARRIDESTELNIKVLMSGGMDSEVVARSFRDQGIPFEAIIFQFEGQDNYDIHYAINFCKYNDINFKLVSFDQNKFAVGQFWEMTDHLQSPQAFVAFDIERWSRAGGYAVFGNGDVHLEYKRGGFYSTESASYALPWVWQNENSLEGCYRFFKARSELQLAFLSHPKLEVWKSLCHEMGFEDSRWWKQWIFKEYWPGMLTRPKRTGFEIINKIYSDLDKICREKHSYNTMTVEIPVQELQKQLSRS